MSTVQGNMMNNNQFLGQPILKPSRVWFIDRCGPIRPISFAIKHDGTKRGFNQGVYYIDKYVYVYIYIHIHIRSSGLELFIT